MQRPGGVMARLSPLGRREQAFDPDALGFFFVLSDFYRGKRESVSEQSSGLSLFYVS